MNKLLFILLLLHSKYGVAQEGRKKTVARPETAKLEGYHSIISKAALSISQNEFEKARTNYQQALIAKPGDIYSITMINYVNEKLWESDQTQKRDAELKRKAEINTLMKQALNAILEKRYDSAGLLYVRVLGLNPANSQAEYARRKIRSIDATMGTSLMKLVVVDSSMKEMRFKETNYAFVPALDQPATAKPKSAKELTSKIEVAKMKVKPVVKELKRSDTKSAFKDSTVGDNAGKTITPKRENKIYSGYSSKKIEKSASSGKEPLIKKVTTVYDVLMDSAAREINLKNYKNARLLYEKVLTSDAPKSKKEFAQMVINAIEEVTKKRK